MGVKRLGICLWMYVCAVMLVTFIATSPWQIFGKESLLQGHQSASVKKQKDKKKNQNIHRVVVQNRYRYQVFIVSKCSLYKGMYAGHTYKYLYNYVRFNSSGSCDMLQWKNWINCKSNLTLKCWDEVLKSKKNSDIAYFLYKTTTGHY